MDLLQIALVFLILLLAIFLSVLGIQVFFILKDLKRSLDKLDLILNDVGKPVQAMAEVTRAVETGVKAVKTVSDVARGVVSRSSKPAKRLFKRK